MWYIVPSSSWHAFPVHVGSSDEGNDTVTVGDDNKDAAASSLLYQHTHILDRKDKNACL